MRYSPTSHNPVVVIGAGPAGLTAAYELAKHGMSSVLVEADTQVGGISRTVNYRGYRFDIGGHRFFSKVRYINELWHEILDEDFLLRPRLSRIHYRGYFFDYPLKPLNALKGLEVNEVGLIGLSYLKSKVFPSLPEESFEQWVSNRFGSRLYNIFFKTYTEKVWGIPCQEISADWAEQRIKSLSLKKAVQHALFSDITGKKKDVVTSLIEEFYYPRLGPGMMWECCERALRKGGNPTLQGENVVRIRHHQNNIESVFTRNAAGEESEFRAEHVVSSMPLRELIFALDPSPPDEVLEAAHGLRYRDYLTVVLIINQQEIFPDNWLYIHTPEVKMGRIQNYKNWSPDMVADQGKTSLGLEYFLWEQDPEWGWPDEQLIDLGRRECGQLGLIDPREVEDGTVVRMKKAYPIYDQHHRTHLHTIRQYLANFSNLFPVGRNGQHRYNNQDHSMLTGVFAARNITGETYDIWDVNTEQAYHEKHQETAARRGDRLVPTRLQAGVASSALPESSENDIAIEQLLEKGFSHLDPLALGVAVGTVSGTGLLLATIILLLKGGEVIGPRLALLGHYLLGYTISWTGAFIGLFEAALVGFVLGYGLAQLRNWGMLRYAIRLKKRLEAEEERDALGKII
ncbi:FAD-dependent oxidoreductase [candidate division KSB3 bacterium]|uniref:FAD-dependent oxidoreductase n=1 Tax=candidate division KSB3 bacterium TaxID=2044937 RepID=A0A2G6K8V5_9BACT|nr:MAG: FAD-dependent oxidoreductase [candidate division KSB3 bacterium]